MAGALVHFAIKAKRRRDAVGMEDAVAGALKALDRKSVV